MAAAIGQRFVTDPDSVSATDADLYLSIASRNGDAKLWQGLLDTLPRATTPGIRSAIVRGLGSFRDPALLESSLDLLLDGTLRSQDYRTLLGGVEDESRHVAWEWLQLRYDELLRMLGPMSAPRVPNLTAGFCSEERAAEVEAFFEAAAQAPVGTERNVNLALESIARCVRLRAAIREPLRAWLGAQSSVLPSAEPGGLSKAG